MKKPLFKQWVDGKYSSPGSFELLMFRAYQVADAGNMQKLEKAFPEFFAEKGVPITDHN